MTCETCTNCNPDTGWCDMHDRMIWGCILPDTHEGSCERGFLPVCADYNPTASV